MSTLDARHLETDADGAELLASVVHGTKRGRAKAVARGRCRVAAAAKGIDAWIHRPPRPETRGAGLDLPLPA